ncbi:MAG: hypothetical protein QXY40_10265 [Candidatus Methanomethylicia archaeon]
MILIFVEREIRRLHIINNIYRNMIEKMFRRKVEQCSNTYANKFLSCNVVGKMDSNTNTLKACKRESHVNNYEKYVTC